jgi:hypothetical protein
VLHRAAACADASSLALMQAQLQPA